MPGAALLAIVMLALRVRVEPLTIPPYSIAPGATTDLHPGDAFTLQLDPRGPLTGAVGARAFLTQAGGKTIHDWEPRYLVDKDGTIHVTGAVDKLFAGVPPGDWELDVVVGRPELLPRSAEEALKGRDNEIGAGAWRLLHENVRVGG